MRYGVTMFATDRRVAHRRVRAGGRGPRLHVALRPRAHAHPDEPPDAARRRATPCSPSTTSGCSTRSWRWPQRGGGHRRTCGSAPELRWSRNASRSSPPRPSPRSTTCPAVGPSSASASGGTSTRWSTTGSTPARRRDRHAGAHPRHARAVDRRRGRVPRRVRGLLAVVAVAQARAAGRSAGADGRRARTEAVRGDRRVLRRLDADRRRRRARGAARAAGEACERVRPRPRHGAVDPVRHAVRRGQGRLLRVARASRRSCCGSRRARAIRCSPSSTAWRPNRRRVG